MILIYCGDDDQLNLVSNLFYVEAIFSAKSIVIHN